MPVFAILPADNTKLQPKIETIIPNSDRLLLPGGGWLISHTGTSKELAEMLGISASEDYTTPGIVVAITSYWGRATPDVWEWLQLKLK